MAGRLRLIVVTLLLLPAVLLAQGTARRLTTIEAIREFPGYFHLQHVMLRGEFVDDPRRPLLRSDGLEMLVVPDDAGLKSGPVEVRGLVIDAGRLEPGDPRLGRYNDTRTSENWPRPGEEIVLKLASVAEAAPAATPSVRALALEPWKFDGQTVTVTGNFRGRNLFGDTPASPGNGRYDFVLRGAEGAIWVTGLRPRGRGFDLDVDRRLDTDKWVEVTGTVMKTRGLASIAASRMTLAQPPAAPIIEDAPPPPPPPPMEVVFSLPIDGEFDVPATAPVRIQLSRGLRDATVEGRIRASYVGVAGSTLPTTFTYDAATRSLEIRFTTPLEPFRTVKVELLEGLLAFDGGPFVPWSVTFTVGPR